MGYPANKKQDKTIKGKISYLPMYSTYLKDLQAHFQFKFSIYTKDYWKILIEICPEVLSALIEYLSTSEDWKKKPQFASFLAELTKLKKEITRKTKRFI